MAQSCSIKAYCKNPKGEVVESKLFNDLLHYTSNNRALTKEYYGIGTNPEFLDKVSDRIKLDENGEITLNSLKKVTNFSVAKSQLLNTLNDDIKTGNYEYSEAMSKLQSFNRNNEFNDDYLATIERNNNGTYNLSVVDRTPENEAKLNKIIANQSLQDRIKYYLNKAGVDIGFLEEDDKVDGRYSTKNATKTADGMYQLIQVAKGEKLTDNLAEEAGHFAIGALGNSPLVNRLMNILTPNVQKRIMGEEYDSKYFGDSSKREVAGTLVGQYIAGHVDERAPWQSLVNRIIDKAKRIFYSIKGNDIAIASMQANKLAEQIAKGFMSPTFTGSIDNALNTKETLYSAKNSVNVKTYKQIVNRLKLQAAEMKEISPELFQRFNSIVGLVENGKRVDSGTTFGDMFALEGVAESVALISDLLVEEIPNLLDSVDFVNTADFYTNMPRNAKALRAVRVFARNALAIIDLINSTTSRVPGAEVMTGDFKQITSVDMYGNRINYDLLAMTDKLTSIITGREGMLNSLKNKESQYFLQFLQESMGKNYIDRAARVIFKWKNNGGRLLQFKNPETLKISDILNNLENDISLFDKWLGSMSNNSDVVGQLADKMIKAANKNADDLTAMAQDQLRVLQSELKEAGHNNTDIFCERSNITGKITGNIISEHCWGDYEDDWLEFKRNAMQEFKDSNPNLDNLSDFEKGLLWGDFFKPKAKAWHKGSVAGPAHSVWNSQRNMYVPSAMYNNPNFNQSIKSNPALFVWLNKYMELKESLDSRLPEGSIPLHRMPQFKGTFSNKIRNRRIYESSSNATKHTIRDAIRDTFCEDSEDTDYGSDQTYNTIEEDMFSDQLAIETEKINRVPLFGINKLKDTSELSTDLFHSTFAYAGMANTYLAISQVSDTLEVGKEVLSRRTVGSLYTENERSSDKSRAYNRYLKFLDKQVYGIGVPKIKIGNKIVLNKIIGAMTRLGSIRFLGGNVAGGAVNAITGFTEVFKEAAAGEYYTLNDWKKANQMYFKSLPANWWGAGKEFKEDKISLMIRHFNILSDNKTLQREWHTRDSRIENMFGRSLFLPYKSGDHYMQTMSYLALANGTKLYDNNGNKISLFNAYKVVDNTDENGNYKEEYGKTLKIPEVLFKNQDSKETYDLINSIITKINNSVNPSSIFSNVINLTKEEQDYLDSHNYNIASTDNVIHKLEDDAYKLTWSIDDESDFMNKAREISNRLHGIYNNQDKVMFQQNLMGNMIASMKGYALGMLERRVGVNKYNTVLQNESEGSLRTLVKVLGSTFTDRGGFNLTMRAILMPVSSKTKQQLLAAGFSANQYYNMRRNFFDGAVIILFTLLKMLTANGDDDKDDEETNDALGLIYYFTSRAAREQMAFNTPLGAQDEYNNLMSMTPMSVAALMDLGKFAYEVTGSALTEDDDSSFYYQSSKDGAYEKGQAKWEKHFFRMFPYLRSTYVFTNPYDASAAFEYGRKVRN